MMDPSRETHASSQPSIESIVTEVSSDGHSEVQTVSGSGKANGDDGQIQCTSSNSVGDPPGQDSECLPESSSMNGSDQNGIERNEEEEDDMDSMSEISDFSDFSQESWHPVQGPIAWVQEQMRLGQSARSILEDLVPPGTMIPDDIDPIMMWRLIINIVSEPPKRKKLENINTLEDVIGLMKSCSKIIVLTGAGVSVSCGIPDFRSRDGVYARLAVDFPNLPDPQAMFDIQFFRSDPRPFYKFAKEIYPGQFKPSLCHHFIRLIESQGKLLRNYTQNIDTLEQEAGIERVVQCHGSFATATCTSCKLKVKADVVREDIFKQVIPKCPQCPEGTENAIMKPDIVFFGESLPEDFHKQMAQDKDECDLLIVIGSSLKVRPVALIPNSVPAHVPQILINRERLSYLSFDVELLGNSDDIVAELCRRLGTGWDQLAPPQVSPLTEVALSSLPTPPTSPQGENLEMTDAAASSEENKCIEASEVKNNEVSLPIAPSVALENSASSASKEEQKKGDGECGETVSCTDCGSDSKNGEELETDTATVNYFGQGDSAGGYAVIPVSSSCSSSVESSVSSSNLPPTTSHASAVNKAAREDTNNAASNALRNKVSTSTSAGTIPIDPGSKEEQDVNESDIVSSTSGEHNTHHHKHHHHHHKHSHHNHHHHHHHPHNHNHRGHSSHHHHHHLSSDGKSPKREHHHHHKHENGDHKDTTEPIQKRARLESVLESESSSKTKNNSDENELMMTASESQQPQQIGELDDELEEMRKMWQGRKHKVSLAQRLAEDQFLFLPPNRYVFKGAEVFSSSEEDDSDSDNDSNDGKEIEENKNESREQNGSEHSNDSSTEVVKELLQLQEEEAEEALGSVSSQPSKSIVAEDISSKEEADRQEGVSSTNQDDDSAVTVKGNQ